jgi:hypothetical protein
MDTSRVSFPKILGNMDVIGIGTITGWAGAAFLGFSLFPVGLIAIGAAIGATFLVKKATTSHSESQEHPSTSENIREKSPVGDLERGGQQADQKLVRAPEMRPLPAQQRAGSPPAMRMPPGKKEAHEKGL